MRRMGLKRRKFEFHVEIRQKIRELVVDLKLKSNTVFSVLIT